MSWRVLREPVVVRRRGSVGAEQLVDRRSIAQPGGTLPGKQPRQKIGAVGRHLEQRLVDQMLQHVLAADVDDEGDLRTNRDDVGEVLFGSDSQVDAIGPGRLLERRNHRLESGFIRQEVLGLKCAARLRRLLDQRPERRIVDLTRQGIGGAQSLRDPQRGDHDRRRGTTAGSPYGCAAELDGKGHESSKHLAVSRPRPVVITSPAASQFCFTSAASDGRIAHMKPRGDF